MADKSFGVKELNLLNASGTPTVTSPNNLNLNANTVAISTSCTIGNNLTVTSTTNSANLNVTGIGTLTRGFATDLSVSGISTISQPSNANPHSLWDVVNNGSSAYRFTGPGQDGAEDNPNIYLVRGQRYIFKVNASGHPFQLRVANGGAAYSDGVTNNGAQSGNVVINVQHDAPAQLYYQCTNHGGMVGNIYIVGGPQVISGVVTATTFVGNLTGNVTGNATGLSGTPNISAGTIAGSTGTFTGDLTIPDKIVHAGDTDTAIRFPADNTVTVEAGGSERIRIYQSKILKGLTSARGNYGNNTSGVEYGVQIEGTTAITSSMSLVRNSDDANDGGIILGKTRATSTGGNTVVQAGDDLGTLTFAGSDGSTMLFGAEIFAEVESGVGNDDMPAALVFKTNGGSTSTAERLRIESDGTVKFDPSAGGTLKIGGSSAHTSKIVIADNAGTGNGNCLVEGGDGTDFFTIQSNGNVAFENGKGINFGATAGSGASSSIFDDYEEGSWTPNIRNTGTTATWTGQTGRYVKIGQQVTVWFNADGGSSPRSGGTSSSLIMTGLPFSQSIFGNPILGSVGANKSSGTGLYSTIGVILSPFGQGGTQVRFGAGGQPINFGIDYVAGCLTYTAAS